MISVLIFLAVGLCIGLWAMPQKIEGSKYAFLRIRNCYLVFTSNGQKKLVENVHYYGPPAGVCSTSSVWSASSKTGLVTFSAGISSAGVSGVPPGVATLYGFQTTCVNQANALNSVLSVGALSNGIYAKWLDVTTDYDQQVGTNVPSTIPPTAATTGNGTTSGGIVGSLLNRLPLDNHVTFRKFTGVAGKEWSRGRWKFAPISNTQVAEDELTAGAQANWSYLKTFLYSPITDGTNTGGVANVLYPCILSTKLSQLRRMPTKICYAPLVLPGFNYLTGTTNVLINATIGEQKRRKEKPDVVF